MDPDLAVGVWGTTCRHRAGYSTRALQTNDNVGVQYGSTPWLAGAINQEEFVTLNEGVGGSRCRFESDRRRALVADAAALPIAYLSGLVNEPASQS